jgi:hypothetical protein
MRQPALRQICRTDKDHHLNIEIPVEFGDHVEVIIRPFNQTAQTTQAPTEEESFNLAACAAVLEDDEQEDAIWEKYVRD